jgi:coenzyme F420-reducing hydrogenase delta subunit
MIFKALTGGYDGILVSGCHPGDCHFGTGNYFARRRLAIVRQLLETIGIDPQRLHFTWISAAEGKRFAEVCSDFHKRLSSLSDSAKVLAQESIDR